MATKKIKYKKAKSLEEMPKALFLVKYNKAYTQKSFTSSYKNQIIHQTCPPSNFAKNQVVDYFWI
ncbi:MAG: hypothetical protein U0T72_12115 [Chitinophagales bacterium]